MRQKSLRQAQAAKASSFDPEVVAKRTKRHLDELERSNSNYAETTGVLGFVDDEDGEAGGRTAKGRARQTISDKRAPEGGRKKKSTMNVRTAVIYRKTFTALLEDADLSSYPSSTATYLTAAAPPPSQPPRMICSVCGYFGRYRCKKCAMVYCDKNCEEVHEETRCERRVF
ncbi:hypothetical protein BXZ70DRAFT_137572 [Cristinia sonorae]|uniref:HIT-type domain-containing protein n=1 Tax=Cristinia sonorae TaxID=1940300 RepID=A0A8K0UQ27_9AGAR|nr:hypothetical protein BXZ70DRAFT_137572 [Cristinia sonorae]